MAAYGQFFMAANMGSFHALFNLTHPASRGTTDLLIL